MTLATGNMVETLSRGRVVGSLPSLSILTLCLCLAEYKSHAWNPLLVDFTCIFQKLEKLGFIYDGSKVVILEHETNKGK